MLCGARATESIINFLANRDLFGIVLCINFIGIAVAVVAIIFGVVYSRQERAGEGKLIVFFILTAMLSVIFSAVDCYRGEGKFGSGFAVFFHNAVYVFFLTALYFGYMFTGGKKRDKSKVKSEEEIRGEIRKYFENKNPFSNIDATECIADGKDEINFDFLDKLIDKIKKNDLSLDDKKQIEDIEIFIASSKNREDDMDKSRFSDYVMTLMAIAGKYDADASITQDVSCENDKGDTNDTVFRYRDDGTCSG